MSLSYPDGPSGGGAAHRTTNKSVPTMPPTKERRFLDNVERKEINTGDGKRRTSKDRRRQRRARRRSGARRLRGGRADELPPQDLLFVRHGQSCANALKWAGKKGKRGSLAADSALTEIGIEQAQQAADELLREVDDDLNAFVTVADANEREAIAIFVSPLRRTLETAREIGEVLTQGENNFVLIPMAGLVEVGASFGGVRSPVRSDDNVPATFLPQEFEDLVEHRLQTAYEADGSAKEGAYQRAWNTYSFGDAWREMETKARRDHNITLGQGKAIVVSHHARIEMYTGVEKEAKASCMHPRYASALCDVPSRKLGNCAIVYVAEGNRNGNQAWVVWAGVQPNDAIPTWDDLAAPCGEEVAEMVERGAGGLERRDEFSSRTAFGDDSEAVFDETDATLRDLKRKLRAGEVRTGVRDVAGRRAVNRRIEQWRERA